MAALNPTCFVAFPFLPPVPGDALVGQRVAAAVSGGADSVALALWLHDFATRPAPAFTLVGLIHVNHALRGADSDADEAFCRYLAGRLSLPIDVVAAPITVTGRSPETAARTARYLAFDAAAARLGATVVCTGHTADDQAETVLLRLLRGAGLRGLSGIRSANRQVVRPLLDCRRSHLRAALVQLGEPWREDSSNTDVSIPRNLVRHELLPAVERVATRIAPGGIEAVARFAAYASEDEQFLEDAAVTLASRLVTSERADGAGRVLTLVRDKLASAPASLARRVVRLAAAKVAPDRPWSAVHIEAVLKLARRIQGGGSLDLPGIRVERVSNEVRLMSQAGTIRPGDASD
jgi:tRNA(Ile)-lysidine synthase